MIFKSSTRGGLVDLAAHLLNAEANEVASVSFENGLGTMDLTEALWLLQLESQSMTKAKTPFIHASCSPDQTMDQDVWARSWRAFEDEFGLAGATFIEVTHVKLGRLHKHRVYSRWNASSGQSADYNHWSKIRDEVVSRTLEHDLGHLFTSGPHDKEAMYRLRRAGRSDVADWIETNRQARGHKPTYRARGERRWTEHQADQRQTIKTRESAATIFRLWQACPTGQQFRDALAAAGFTLAQGDKSPFIVVAPDGRAFDLGRSLRQGAKAVGQDFRITRKKLLEALADVAPSLKPAGAATTAPSDASERRQRRPNPWKTYQAERQSAVGARATALAALKERHKAELRAEAERFRATWPQIRERLRSPKDYHRARSIFAMTKAESFAALKSKHRAQRRACRLQQGVPTYDQWLAAQAEQGHRWAARHLASRKTMGRFRAAPSSPGAPIEPLDLTALTGIAAHYPLADGVCYLDTLDQVVMSDHGRTIDMHQIDENSIRAALLLAREKWGPRVRLVAEGTAEFTAAAEKVAAELGIDVAPVGHCPAAPTAPHDDADATYSP